MNPKSDFLALMQSRGYLHQCTNLLQLDNLMKNQSIVAYIGFDCTAKSLHLGSLVQIMVLRYLQKLGHKPLVLLGGGTTKVGDPSGKDKSRQILSEQEIQANMSGIKDVLTRFLSFDEENSGAIIVNNNDWLSSINYIDFLRDIGKHFSINRMLSFDSVKLRLEREQNLSFLEFNYMILQAYDFVVLKKKYGCCLQIGGSDQWGNIVNGIELAKKLELEEIFGMTTPLVLKSSGEKMGKTATGAVWLDGDPYEYWQYFRNIADSDVERFLYLFTELPISEIVRLSSLQDKDINEAKKILATEATKICYGEEITNQVANSSVKYFEQNDSSQLPKLILNKNDFAQGITVLKLLNMTKLLSSGSEARKIIREGGVKINDEVINDINYVVKEQDFAPNLKLSLGKKRHINLILS